MEQTSTQNGVPRKDSILVYRTWVDTFRSLPLEDVGALVIAMCDYGMDRIEPEFENPTVKAYFGFIRGSLDSAYRNWQHKCEQNKKNRNAYKNQSSPVVTNGDESSHDVTNRTYKEEDEENEYDEGYDKEEEQDDVEGKRGGGGKGVRGKTPQLTLEDKVDMLDAVISDGDRMLLDSFVSRATSEDAIISCVEKLNERYKAW